MVKREIGRNDPCPCGSGKKFKKCCQNNNTPNTPATPTAAKMDNQNLPPRETIDYGTPLIDEAFFSKNEVHKISAPRLLYSNLISPKIEPVVAEVMNRILNRGKNEASLIENANDVLELINIMKRGPDPLNTVRLMEKLLEQKEVTVPIILQELMKPQIDACVELAVRIIPATGVDYSDRLIEIITRYQRDAYTVSLLCMLVGFYDNPKAEKLLWDYYHYFRENFPNYTYSDGPLLGLEEIRIRRKQKKENFLEDSSNKQITIH